MGSPLPGTQCVQHPQLLTLVQARLRKATLRPRPGRAHKPQGGCIPRCIPRGQKRTPLGLKVLAGPQQHLLLGVRISPTNALGTARGFPAAAVLTSWSPREAPPLLLGQEPCAAARDSAAMAGPAAPCDPCAPAAVWKRHIVRQLRHRDRTQKALFLELVPACECVPWGSGMTGFEEVGLPAGGEGLSRRLTCDSGQRRLLSSRGPCILEPVTPLSGQAESLPAVSCCLALKTQLGYP